MDSHSKRAINESLWDKSRRNVPAFKRSKLSNCTVGPCWAGRSWRVALGAPPVSVGHLSCRCKKNRKHPSLSTFWSSQGSDSIKSCAPTATSAMAISDQLDYFSLFQDQFWALSQTPRYHLTLSSPTNWRLAMTVPTPLVCVDRNPLLLTKESTRWFQY